MVLCVNSKEQGGSPFSSPPGWALLISSAHFLPDAISPPPPVPSAVDRMAILQLYLTVSFQVMSLEVCMHCVLYLEGYSFQLYSHPNRLMMVYTLGLTLDNTSSIAILLPNLIRTKMHLPCAFIQLCFPSYEMPLTTLYCKCPSLVQLSC